MNADKPQWGPGDAAGLKAAVSCRYFLSGDVVVVELVVAPLLPLSELLPLLSELLPDEAELSDLDSDLDSDDDSL